MGTNYYMRLREPVRGEARLGDIVDYRKEHLLENPDMMVPTADYKAVHVAKCSWGWVPSFQAVPAYMPFDETEANNDLYRIESVQDIRNYLETGKYEIIDEYGETMTPEDFEHRVVRWCDRQREGGFEREFGNHTKADGLRAYQDAEGNQMCRTCFC